MAYLIAYGSFDDSDRLREAAERWAADHGFEVLLHRNEGREAAMGPVSERPALAQALFMLRAGFARELWIPAWDVFGGVVEGTIPREVTLAEVDAAGAVLHVGDGRGRAATEPAFGETVQECVGIAEGVDPRAAGEEDSDDDTFGVYADEQAAARMAHKLTSEFGLTQKETARLLEDVGYRAGSRGSWNAARVSRLLSRHAAPKAKDAAVVQAARGSAGVKGPAMLTVGADDVALLDQAEEYARTLSTPYRVVQPLSRSGGGPRREDGELSDAALQVLVLGARLELVGTVYASSKESFGRTTARREALYAHLWRHGTAVVVGGEPVDPCSTADDEAVVLRQAARQCVALRSVLRAHDRDIVMDRRQQEKKARVLAHLRRREGWTYQQIADELNREGYLTRERGGKWGPSAVSWLLERGAER
ncbi:recombinase family protein [Ornithinimicrobium sp. W1679]|uniref:recombinase family protein n=1 Tax=Ornithinimicrobium sp. W1679 TaxID=3418770 RepID=UPI003CE9659A